MGQIGLLAALRILSLSIGLATAGCAERPSRSHGDASTARPGIIQQDTASISAPPVASTDSVPSTWVFPTTHVAHGACPFECCQYGEWTFQAGVTLRSAPAVDSDSLATIVSGTTIAADSGLVIVQRIGLAIVTRTPWQDSQGSPVPFAIGDSVALLDYVGEGYYRVRWRRGELEVAEDYWDSTRGAAKLIREPVQTWWVHLTDRRANRRGWVLMDGVRVGGSDACA